jgi:hypothetical protein
VLPITEALLYIVKYTLYWFARGHDGGPTEALWVRPRLTAGPARRMNHVISRGRFSPWRSPASTCSYPVLDTPLVTPVALLQERRLSGGNGRMDAGKLERTPVPTTEEYHRAKAEKPAFGPA